MERNIDIGQLGSFLNEVPNYAKVRCVFSTPKTLHPYCKVTVRRDIPFPPLPGSLKVRVEELS